MSYSSHNEIIMKINGEMPSTWAAAAAKSRQLCPTLCDPRDSSPPGSPVSGILRARTLEWVAISFSNTWKWKVKVKLLSRVWMCATPWTAAPPGSSIHGIFQARVLEWFYLDRHWLLNYNISIVIINCFCVKISCDWTKLWVSPLPN